MRYFFIDDEANLYYLSSLARLQKVVRLSSNFKDIRTKLAQMGEKYLALSKYNPLQPRHYQSDAILPFSNRTCIDIKEKEAKDDRGYQLFGLIDEDTPLLYEEIMRLTGRKKVEQPKRKSVLEDEKNRQELRTEQFVRQFLDSQERFKMEHVGEGNNEVDFQGDGPAREANGKGVQTIIKEGLTYTGYFQNGKKHGAGLLVSESLDSLSCEFIDDELAGI